MAYTYYKDPIEEWHLPYVNDGINVYAYLGNGEWLKCEPDDVDWRGCQLWGDYPQIDEEEFKELMKKSDESVSRGE